MIVKKKTFKKYLHNIPIQFGLFYIWKVTAANKNITSPNLIIHREFTTHVAENCRVGDYKVVNDNTVCECGEVEGGDRSGVRKRYYQGDRGGGRVLFTSWNTGRYCPTHKYKGSRHNLHAVFVRALFFGLPRSSAKSL